MLQFTTGELLPQLFPRKVYTNNVSQWRSVAGTTVIARQPDQAKPSLAGAWMGDRLSILSLQAVRLPGQW
ncbi:hypothetical protein J6590_034297 [Homalodisca vitripennis]|nr:hypothetical protein J6590_034297 [Homalodisca vitripennis]